MNGGIPSHLLSHVSRRIEAWMGLFFPPERWTDLERKLHALAPTFGCADAEACARLLTTVTLTKQQMDVLAIHLTVGETYFFREPRSLEVLEEHILPKLLQARRGVDQRLRFWSAACCTGEEPYSLAIMLHRLLVDLPLWRTTILATDISPRFLRKAAEGVYSQWSFRSVPTALREQYFRPTANGRYALQPTLKNMVRFSQLNLVEDTYPSPMNNTGDMDVILCRNVLIYFTAERIQQILEQFHRSLVDGGWLIVSPVETAFAMDSPFTPVQFPGVTLFRKDPEKRAAQLAPGFFASPVAVTPVESPPLPVSEPQSHGGSAPEVATTSTSHTPAASESRTQASHSSPPAAWATIQRLYKEAHMLYTHGRYTEVAEKLLTVDWTKGRNALSSGFAREQAMALLARAYANQGRLAEAQTWCDQALVVNKCDAGLHYLRATILLECGQESEARLSLTRALYLDQRFVLAHFVLGNMARQRKEWKEASKHFANALALLHHYQPEDILPESEGMSAGRLARIIADMNERE